MRQIIRLRIFWFAILIIGDAVFFTQLNPLSSPSPLLFVAFLLLAANVYLLVRLIFVAWQAITGKPVRSAKRIATISCGLVVVLLALQSVGQLTTRDGVALVILGLVAVFYMSYLKTRRAA